MFVAECLCSMLFTRLAVPVPLLNLDDVPLSPPRVIIFQSSQLQSFYNSQIQQINLTELTTPVPICAPSFQLSSSSSSSLHTYTPNAVGDCCQKRVKASHRAVLLLTNSSACFPSPDLSLFLFSFGLTTFPFTFNWSMFIKWSLSLFYYPFHPPFNSSILYDLLNHCIAGK